MGEPLPATVTFTREKLYEQVWSQPMRRLAPTYGISDVGLSKICRKLQVPTPPVGYWQKKEFGHDVERPPLPKLDEEEEHQSVKLNEVVPQTNRPLSEVEVLIHAERQDDHRIVIPEQLDAPHPLVEKTDRSLRAAKVGSDALAKPRAKDCLSVSVSRQSIDRATRIMDALVKALESRGFPVSAGEEGEDGDTNVEILGETIRFCLEEILEKKERELTPAQKRERERYAWMGTRRPEYDYFPSGRLALTIGESCGDTGTRRRWSDTETRHIETLLNQFVAGLVRAADDEKEKRRKQEEWQRKMQEERKKRQDAEIERREAESRARDFENKIAAWRKVRELREFTEAVRAEAIRRDGGIDEHSDFARWLQWAECCARAMDPLDAAKPLPTYSANDETKDRWRTELSHRGW